MLKPAYFEQTFNEGVDQSAEELVATGGLDQLVNGEYVKDGGVTKRHGFARPTSYATNAGASDVPHTIVSNGGAAHVLRKLDALPITHGAVSGVNTTARKTFLASGHVESVAQLRDGGGFKGPNCAVGYTAEGVQVACIVGQQKGGGAETADVFIATVVEVVSGAVLDTVALTGRRPQPVFRGTVCLLFFEVYSAGYDIKVVRWNSAGTGVWGSASAALNGGTKVAAGDFAVWPDSASTNTFLAWIETGGTTAHIEAITTTATSAAAATPFAVTAGSDTIAMCQGVQHPELLFLLYTSSTTNVTAKCVSILASLAGSPTASITGLGAPSGSKFWVHLAIADLSTTGRSLIAVGCCTDGTVTNTIDTGIYNITYTGGPTLPATVSSTFQSTIKNAILLAQPLVLFASEADKSTGGTPLLLLSRYTDTPGVNISSARTSIANSYLQLVPLGANFNSTAFGTAHTLLAATTLAGSAYQALGHEAFNYAHHVLSFTPLDQTSLEYFVAQLDLEEAPIAATGLGVGSSTIVYGVRLLKCSFTTSWATSKPLPRATLGPLTYLGGNQLRYYDGVDVGESTPLYPPPLPTLAAIAGGSLDATATYYFSFVWVWEDRKGLVHRSAPTPPQSIVTTGVNKQITMDWANTDVVPTALNAAITGGRAHRVEVYRTEGGGSVYYLDQIALWPEGNVATLTSSQTDLTLVSNKQLYTTGNVLANIHPPPLRALTTVGSRLWGISAIDPRNVVFSKESEEAIAAEFNPVLGLRMDACESEPVALAGMGSLLVMFTKREAWAVSTHGGPDALGVGTFGIPERLATDCGASSAEAAVAVPFGVLVHGSAGFRLLTGDGAIDVPVVQDLADGVTVRRSLHIPEREEVWFLLRGDGTQNRIVVFSYNAGKLRWSTWELQSSVTCKPRDMMSIDGVATLVVDTNTTASKLLQLSTTAYLDDSDQWIPVTVRTRWFKPEGALAADRFWRVHVFGTGGAAKLQAKVYVMDPATLAADDASADSFLSGTYLWTLAKLALDSRLVHVRRRLDRQRGSAARVQLQLQAPESGSYDVKGPVLHSVGWDYGTRGKSAHRGTTFEPA